MWRISSPGEYSLCSANSTDEPWCGERCSPESAPWTIVRALSSRVRTLERATGSRNLIAASPRADRLQEPIHDRRRGLAFRFRLVVDDEAVLQGRTRQRLHV